MAFIIFVDIFIPFKKENMDILFEKGNKIAKKIANHPL